MRTPRVVAAVMLVGVVGAACGARVSPSVRQAAATAVLRTGGSATVETSNPDTSNSDPGTTSNPGPTDSNPTNPNPSNANPSNSNPSNPNPTNPNPSNPNPGTSNPKQAKKTHASDPTKPSSGSGCPTGGTDVGLTSKAITLGTIADRTGPVAGLFAGSQQGAVAFAQYANSLGGICGHSVTIDFADSGTNCSQNQNDTESLVSKVFAFVGSFSLYDGAGCGATVLKAHPTVPDIHVALDPSAETIPNHFDLMPGPLGFATGNFAYFMHRYGAKMKHVGTISENIPSAQAKQNAQVHAAESTGWKFVYANAASPTTSNFTSNFQTMCAKNHIQVFWTITENAQNAATMMSNERSVAACKGVVNIIPIAYDSAFIPDYQGSPSDLNGLVGSNEYALFFNADEARNIPEVALFQQWFKRVNPGQPLNLYAMFAWASGRMFQQAFEAAGPTANRKTVLASLKKITNFTDNGMVAPSTPGSKTAGVHCYIIWQLENGVFSRVDDPKTGFRCDGKFLRYNG